MLKSIAAAGVALLGLAGHAWAQAWPQKPVTFIVSAAAGASPDVMARLLATRLEKIIGQSVVVDNKPGAGNVIGAQAAARAPADGYTFFFATSASLANNPFMMKRLPYDPVKDFSPVAFITRSNQLIVVHKDVPVKTVQELIALAKANPGKYAYGTPGIGAVPDRKRTRLNSSHIP